MQKRTENYSVTKKPCVSIVEGPKKQTNKQTKTKQNKTKQNKKQQTKNKTKQKRKKKKNKYISSSSRALHFGYQI